ncbi:MAG: FAD-dependent oxidoreductase [Solobacterium sp.]|nr:FAD-dependent oxidoreductase [Solobacterium sp.]
MFETRYPHIFSPLTIGDVTFKNRIWAAPAGVHLLMDYNDDAPNDRVVAYYAEKARGGSAVITYSAMNMDHYLPRAKDHANEDIFRPETHRQWQRLTNAIHFYDAKASLELLAFGCHFPDEEGNLHAYSVNGDEGTELMDEAVMRRLADEYALAAENALKCGFDMILIHGGHGLLLSQILSPKYNTRTDAFGGSLENRMKLPLMVLKAIRDRVGRKLLIEYRISGDELAGPDGFTITDCIDVLAVLQEYIDIAHISAGSFFNHTEYVTHPTGFLPAGCNAYLAARVKASDRIHIPVLTLGAFQEPELMEKTLAEGKADIIAMARGTIADAALVNKARDGREDEIIPCIRCLHCLDYERFNELSCSVNPELGREWILPRLKKPAEKKKRVVVIGGGPGGMEAAITAAGRGHEVILLEKRGRLGGKCVFARQAPFKHDLDRFLNWQIRMLERSGTDVRLNTEATPELVAELQPDAIIAAVGSVSAKPDIPGIKSPGVMTAIEVYEKAAKGQLREESFVILGGGLVGCETAVYLSETLEKIVTVIEMKPELASEEFNIPREALIQHLDQSVTCLTSSRCTGIEEHRVTYIDENGREMEAAADRVVLALGMRPAVERAEPFRGLAREFIRIGDCASTGTVRTAVRSGYDAALQL